MLNLLFIVFEMMLTDARTRKRTNKETKKHIKTDVPPILCFFKSPYPETRKTAKISISTFPRLPEFPIFRMM